MQAQVLLLFLLCQTYYPLCRLFLDGLYPVSYTHLDVYKRQDLENGQCLISDLYGRVGVIQFHPIFEDLFHAFDTRPPVRKEVE